MFNPRMRTTGWDMGDMGWSLFLPALSAGDVLPFARDGQSRLLLQCYA